MMLIFNRVYLEKEVVFLSKQCHIKQSFIFFVQFLRSSVFRFSLYENTPMQHTAIFHGCKNDNFQLILFITIFIFLLLNIDCGYTLESPQ